MLLDRLGKELLFLDGGTGSLLQKRGLKSGELPELWNIEHIEDMIQVQSEFFEAGSDIILANTFGANAQKFHSEEYSLEDIITCVVVNAKEAA
jgi:5-methyltetrahydrofolate--homocysteine methyltransferase